MKKWRNVSIISIIILISVFIGYFKFIKGTKIGFINIKDFQYAEISDLATGFFIDVSRLDLKDIDISKLTAFNVILLRGHGLTLSRSIKDKIDVAKKKGVKVLIYHSTTPENDISNISLKHRKTIEAYLNNGGSRNYKMLFRYLRKYLDKKWIFNKTIKEPFKTPDNYLFYPEVEQYFTEYNKYYDFYAKRPTFKKNNPRVAIFTGNIGPVTGRNHIKLIVQGLEKRGMNVFPVSGFYKRLDFLKEIKPDVAIYFPHGRFSPGKGEQAIRYLAEKEIPLLCPVNVFEPFNKWDKSQKGMSGGMLAQSITVPEFDGGIEPYAVSAQFENKKGLYVFLAIPGRWQKFCERVINWSRLRRIKNKDKKVAVFYFKEPGKNAMVASGLEVAPSLLNFLRHLKKEGYSTGRLPKNAKELIRMINKQGPVLGVYAKGAIDDFIKNGDPELVPVNNYNKWLKEKLPKESINQLIQQYGEAPGQYLGVIKNKNSYIAIPRIKFGNIVLLPQILPGFGDDENKIVHGTKKSPPHPYIASYLWIQEGFNADALIHFGTHGSLEFTPWKQVALSNHDWPDILIGTLPHIYLYTIGNVGEAMIAKRRSYATIVSHITPPFNEADLYGDLKKLYDKIHSYSHVVDRSVKREYQKTIGKLIESLNLKKDLKLKDPKNLNSRDIEKIHNYMHTLKTSKITDGLYTLGKSYSVNQINLTSRLMSVDNLAYSMANLAIIKGQESPSVFEDIRRFQEKYMDKSKDIVNDIFNGKCTPLSLMTTKELKELEEWEKKEIKPLSRGKDKAYNNIMKNYKILKKTLLGVIKNKGNLENSFKQETQSIIKGLRGGFIQPSAGGDPIRNPGSVPTGRNLYSIDPEETPSKEAWEVAKKLANSLIQRKLIQNGSYPQKVAFTLWGGEFVRDEGITVGQILYLMGIKPVWNMVGRVHDVTLISDQELNRPRIDVVVQTSGQFRDIAASRIFLINKAVKVASLAKETTQHQNYVRRGSVDIEKELKQKGINPVKSREYSYSRVFGGVNGNYGTGIMGLVESGDKWDQQEEIADQYIRNMGAVYMKDSWGISIPGLFCGALQNTDTIVQSRTSNIYGPLSLDHVYEFMGGLNTAIKKVTGKNPKGYFMDMRNPFNPRVQGLQEAVDIEARTTLLNPKYIRGLTNGGASSAAVFAEILRNTYGWNATKPEIIDKSLWDEINDVYINDRYNLNLRNFFRNKNPYALQEITAVLLESARKGFWNPNRKTIDTLVKLHVDLIRDYDAGCSGFVCNNVKLQKMIENNLSRELKKIYKEKIDQVKTGSKTGIKEGMKMEKQKKAFKKVFFDNKNSLIIISCLIIFTLLLIILGRSKKLRK